MRCLHFNALLQRLLWGVFFININKITVRGGDPIAAPNNTINGFPAGAKDVIRSYLKEPEEAEEAEGEKRV